ncbi:Zinc finger BED domain-containing protein 1 [Portunus trituberculatus]|uniref:Zinc finger BED domain-containing protein 1 n=1 Tax=Portunus trituberculatus TaxID=210409 RepID=A0A5B7HNJ7_PORTR|nr:Zinc finger BED domain-containing protein 1 [Portunus trituberculatus]
MLLQSTVNALEPFEEATKEMSGEKVTSLSKVIPLVRGIQDFMNSCDNMENLSDTSLGRELQLQMGRRFSVIEGTFFLAVCTFLDPRFKKMPFSSSSNIKMVEDRLINMMCSDEIPVTSTSSKALEPVRATPQQRKKSLWSKFDSKLEKLSHTSAQPSSGPHIELRRYAEEPHSDKADDPLAWWKEHAALFPKLQELAKKFLCTPASPVPSERLFSKAGELISHRRSSLKDKNINVILFLNKNL